ncbi:MAG: hypothetical protein JJU15_02175 [Pararhodobacter sp.]|nr:hypothetical protein [Pararhodobacter sp.]
MPFGVDSMMQCGFTNRPFVAWGVPDPDGSYDGPVPASKTSLFDVLEDTGTKTIHYIYDFGDNWHHVIKVEKIGDALPGAECPRPPPNVPDQACTTAAFAECFRSVWGRSAPVAQSGYPAETRSVPKRPGQRR